MIVKFTVNGKDCYAKANTSCEALIYAKERFADTVQAFQASTKIDEHTVRMAMDLYENIAQDRLVDGYAYNTHVGGEAITIRFIENR